MRSFLPLAAPSRKRHGPDVSSARGNFATGSHAAARCAHVVGSMRDALARRRAKESEARSLHLGRLTNERFTAQEGTMDFERPTITDHGSIVDHTFHRCDSATGSDFPPGGKDPEDFDHDKFGECSAS